MAQKDIFNYDVDVKEKQIVAARNAALDLGNGKIALVQTFQGSYGHQVEPIYEAGSSSVYFVNGNPSGTFAFTTLVGTDGWFANILDANGKACADLKTVNIDLTNANEDCDVQVSMNTNLKMEGVILQQIGFSVQAGGLRIENSGQFICAKLTRSK